MATPTPRSDLWAARMISNAVHLAAWTAAWVATLALARFGPGALWNDHSIATVSALVVNVLVGIGMLFANKRHLQQLDELQRMIQLHAMAWALGAGLVAGSTWTLLARHGLIGFNASIAHLIIFMAVTYLVGIVAGVRRYL